MWKLEKNGGALDATHTMKMSWECSLAVEHLPVVLEALGSVPGAGKTAAATTKIDAPPKKARTSQCLQLLARRWGCSSASADVK